MARRHCENLNPHEGIRYGIAVLQISKSVVGYNAASGQPVWFAGEGQFSYCSLHPVRLGEVEQAVIATDRGLTAFRPDSGAVLWRHSWPLEGGGKFAGPSRAACPRQLPTSTGSRASSEATVSREPGLGPWAVPGRRRLAWR